MKIASLEKENEVLKKKNKEYKNKYDILKSSGNQKEEFLEKIDSLNEENQKLNKRIEKSISL